MSTKEEKKLLNDEVITFFSGKKEYRSLSNFWEKDVIIGANKDIRTYESGEHCFHGEKYIRIGRLCTDKERKKQLIKHGLNFIKPSKYKTCADAKKYGGKSGLLLLDSELKDWDIISFEVQYYISKYKLDTYDEVKEDIKNSKTKLLIHPALRTSEEKVVKRIWEGKAIIKDGKIEVLGKNRLGNIWMEIRSI